MSKDIRSMLKKAILLSFGDEEAAAMVRSPSAKSPKQKVFDEEDAASDRGQGRRQPTSRFSSASPSPSPRPSSVASTSTSAREEAAQKKPSSRGPPPSGAAARETSKRPAPLNIADSIPAVSLHTERELVKVRREKKTEKENTA